MTARSVDLGSCQASLYMRRGGTPAKPLLPGRRRKRRKNVVKIKAAVWVFGGTDREANLDDMWRFSLAGDFTSAGCSALSKVDLESADL